MEVFCSTNSDRLYFFVSHHGAPAESAGTGPALLDGSSKDPIFTCQSNSGHLGSRLFQLLSYKVLGFKSALALQMRGITDFHLVIVYPYIDQLRRVVAKDHFGITGIFQFGPKEPPHHWIRK